MAFRRDKRFGDAAEKQVMQVFSDAGFPAAPNEAGCLAELKGHDFTIKHLGQDVRCEVKFDRMQAKTGNLAIEYYNTLRGEPSGIAATTAALWIVVLAAPPSIWVTATSLLRDWVARQPCIRDVACGGDENAAMKLYDSNELLGAIFRRIDGLTPEELLGCINELLADH